VLHDSLSCIQQVTGAECLTFDKVITTFEIVSRRTSHEATTHRVIARITDSPWCLQCLPQSLIQATYAPSVPHQQHGNNDHKVWSASHEACQHRGEEIRHDAHLCALALLSRHQNIEQSNDELAIATTRISTNQPTHFASTLESYFLMCCRLFVKAQRSSGGGGTLSQSNVMSEVRKCRRSVVDFEKDGLIGARTSSLSHDEGSISQVLLARERTANSLSLPRRRCAASAISFLSKIDK
jgi:hypothetical protein